MLLGVALAGRHCCGGSPAAADGWNVQGHGCVPLSVGSQSPEDNAVQYKA